MGYVKMSIVKVREYFREFRMENRILEFPVSSATVQLAAEALHCEPARIAKTLSLMQSSSNPSCFNSSLAFVRFDLGIS